MTSPYPLRLLLVRHAQSVSNTRPHLIAGRAESVPLTALGVEQAEALAASLQQADYTPHLALCSSAVRTTETIRRLLSRPAGSALLPCVTSPLLLEQDQGSSTGQPRAEVYTEEVRRRMREQHVDFKLAGGESIREAGQRALGFILKEAEIAARQRQSADELRVLVVTHAMVIRGLLYLLLGLRGENVWRIACENCSLTELSLDSSGVSLLRLCDGRHIHAIPH